MEGPVWCLGLKASPLFSTFKTLIDKVPPFPQNPPGALLLLLRDFSSASCAEFSSSSNSSLPQEREQIFPFLPALIQLLQDGWALPCILVWGSLLGI